MCDVFSASETVDVYRGKSILFLGDSIMRNIYKDHVCLLQPDKNKGSLIPQEDMQVKRERHFMGDNLVHATEVTAGRDYEEERDIYLKDQDIQLSFIFITK